MALLPSLTLALIALTVVASIAAFSDQRLFRALLFEPFVIKARGQWYRFVSHAFIHANWPHLLVNMLVLFSFGQQVERALAAYTVFPAAVFVTLYLGGVVFSALPGFKRHAHDTDYRAVGASGAVSAVLFAYVVMTPANGIQFLFLPRPVPAWIFGALYLAYSWYMDKRNEDNVAHDAHFYGAVFGILFMVITEPRLVPAFFEQLLA